MKIKISIEEIRKYLDIDVPEFPKYVAPLINLANQYAQGTRPKVVGQMSELIQEFGGKTLSEWQEWLYQEKARCNKKCNRNDIAEIERN